MESQLYCVCLKCWTCCKKENCFSDKLQVQAFGHFLKGSCCGLYKLPTTTEFLNMFAWKGQ